MHQKLKLFSLLTSFFLFSCSIVAQNKTNFHPILIDGSISYPELIDVLNFKNIESKKFILIRESETDYYIGIKSNTSTAVNLLIKSNNYIRILHASFSLGDSFYLKEKGEWKSVMPYHWGFQDRILDDSTSIKNRISLDTELLQFYKNKQWVANTIPMGSFNDMEFIVSKKLIPDLSNLIIQFKTKDIKGNKVLTFYPNTINTITNNINLDNKLLNGYLPRFKRFLSTSLK